VTALATPADTGTEVRRAPGPVTVFWGRLRRKRLAMLSLVVITVIYGAGIFAPVLAPYSYSATNLDGGLQGPSAEHWFGTDRLGRDMFSRTLYSARTTLIVSAAVLVSGGLVIGNGLGLLSGYRGGWVDNVIMRIGEVLSALPGLPMLILVNAALGGRILGVLQHEWLSGLRPFASYFTVFAVLSLFFWVGTARIVRAQVLQLRERDFVTAARALGGGTRHIIWVHLVPNIAFLLVLQLSSTLGAVAGSEIALTWFGVGVQPPTPSFGAMIYEGSGARTFQTHPHLLLVPGICVSALLFAFALLGDAINDVIRQR
jgi:oligopeptide transport system permease protein